MTNEIVHGVEINTDAHQIYFEIGGRPRLTTRRTVTICYDGEIEIDLDRDETSSAVFIEADEFGKICDIRAAFMAAWAEKRGKTNIK